MSDKKEPESELTTREKLVVILTIFLIQLISPWEYNHKYKEFFKEIKSKMDN